MTTQTYKLNVTPGTVGPTVNISQYDKGARTIVFELYNEDGTQFTIPANSIITVRGTKPDKTGFEYACGAGSYDVSFDIQDQMSVLAGIVPSEIRITKNGNILGTINFTIKVEPSALAEDTIISETYLPLLEEAEQFAIQAANSADDSAGYANESAGYASEAESALNELKNTFNNAFKTEAYNAQYTVAANSSINLTEQDFGVYSNVPTGYYAIAIVAVFTGNNSVIPFRTVVSAGYAPTGIILGLRNISSSSVTATAIVTFLYTKRQFVEI